MRLFIIILIVSICGSLLGCSALPHRDSESKPPRNPFQDFKASDVERIDVCRPTPGGREGFCISPVTAPITDRKTISTLHAYLVSATPYWFPRPGFGPLEYTKGPLDFLTFRDKAGRVLAAVSTYSSTVRIVPAYGRKGRVFANFCGDDISGLPEFWGPDHHGFLQAIHNDMKENQPDWAAIAHRKELFPEVEDYLSLWDEVLSTNSLSDFDDFSSSPEVYCDSCGTRLTDLNGPCPVCYGDLSISGKLEHVNGAPQKTTSPTNYIDPAIGL